MSNNRRHRQLHHVCDRFRWRCFHCGAELRCALCLPFGEGRAATRDHFIPKSKGGGNGLNLVASCWPCNKKKGDGELVHGMKRPKARSLGGCQFGRPPRSARQRRPHKAFNTWELAEAMVTAIRAGKDVDLAAWECPACGAFHITSHNFAQRSLTLKEAHAADGESQTA